MLYHFNVCLINSDDVYFSCPFDSKVNGNWAEIIETALNYYHGYIFDENTIIFPSKECIAEFMVYFTQFYASPLKRKGKKSKKSN